MCVYQSCKRVRRNSAKEVLKTLQNAQIVNTNNLPTVDSSRLKSRGSGMSCWMAATSCGSQMHSWLRDYHTLFASIETFKPMIADQIDECLNTLAQARFSSHHAAPKADHQEQACELRTLRLESSKVAEDTLFLPGIPLHRLLWHEGQCQAFVVCEKAKKVITSSAGQ